MAQRAEGPERQPKEVQQRPDLERLVERAPYGVFRYLFAGGLVYANPGMASLMRRPAEALLGDPRIFAPWVHPDSLPEFEAALDRLRRGGTRRLTLTLRLAEPEAETQWVEMILVPVQDERGAVVGMDGLVQDVTQMIQVADLLSRRTRQQAVLLQAQRELLGELDLQRALDMIVLKAQGLLDALTCALFLVEGDGETLTPLAAAGQYAGRVMALRLKVGEGVTGWVVERGLPVRINRVSQDERVQHLPGVVEEDASVLCAPLQIGDRTAGALLLMGAPGQFSEDDLDFLVALAQVASLAIANSRLFDEVQRLAITDGLTGAFNRGFFESNLKEELERAERLGYPVGLLILDVDNLKKVNDHHGHLAGDELLRQVVHLLRQNIRETDWVARYGGDEFAVVLPGVDLARLRPIGEKLHRALRGAEIPWPEGGPIRISASFGGAAYPENAGDAQELVRAADEAERRAKQAGGDRVIIQPPDLPPR